MPNRLAQSTSPYLLQHQNNPVDWFPWGAEAFEKAVKENKPIFLSIGYSSCHWCHVMEHESFEDDSMAALLNEHFVCIKVDREERPDVDEAYMTAVQLQSGRGGWPMSLFLTPERKPFFAATYLPLEDRGQHPGFRTVTTQISKGWHGKREEFEAAAADFSKAVAQAITREGPRTFTKLDAALLENAIATLISEFDSENGGFGAAPKFPPHTSLAFLMDYVISPVATDELAKTAISVSLMTLEAIALGGIFDHVGGGFHRYSTDAEWILPHFEKMLYDNALMVLNFAKAVQLTMEAEPSIAGFYAHTAARTVEWLNREMLSENGLYGSGLDADSEGEEGRYYVWTEEEIRTLLGDRAAPFIEAFSVKREGNFHDEATGALSGKNVLFAAEAPDEEFEEELATLLHYRLQRVRPAFDDKQIVGWNGLLLSALASVGEIKQAAAIADGILAAEAAHGSLPHQIGKGRPDGRAFLDDYAAFVVGLLDLATTLMVGEDLPGAQKWHNEAARLGQEMISLFYDSEKGGFFMTSDNHETLFGRSKPVFDQPSPSGNSLAVQALLRLGDLERARKTLESFVGWMEAAPQATEGLLLASLWLLEHDLDPTSETEPEDGELGEVVVLPIAEAAESGAAPDPEPVKDVQVRLREREIKAAGGVGKGVVVIQVPAGLHLNSNEPPARWLIPTAVKVDGVEAEVHYPAAVNDQFSGLVEIGFTAKLPKGERGADFEVTVTYQACTDSECLAPEEKRLNGVVYEG
jgi:uncharacterized protein YyaL (SSP411 family)